MANKSAVGEVGSLKGLGMYMLNIVKSDRGWANPLFPEKVITDIFTSIGLGVNVVVPFSGKGITKNGECR